MTVLLAAALAFGIGQGKKPPQPLDNLKSIGDRIVRAVLQKDIATLLAYDWPDPGSGNESALENPRSPLHCYVFDTRCNPPGRPSVFEMFSSWRKLKIQASSAGSNFAVLYFYDSMVVSARSLRSQKVRCREGGRLIVSWVFKFESGRWIAANEPFDFDADTLCPHR